MLNAYIDSLEVANGNMLAFPFHLFADVILK